MLPSVRWRTDNIGLPKHQDVLSSRGDLGDSTFHNFNRRGCVGRVTSADAVVPALTPRRYGACWSDAIRCCSGVPEHAVGDAGRRVDLHQDRAIRGAGIAELPEAIRTPTCRFVSVRLRTHRTENSWNNRSALILCGRCGADRLIPLTFTPSRRDDRHRGGWPDASGRPLFKCLECRTHLGRGAITRPRSPQRPTPGAMLEPRAPDPVVREVGPSG